eukprot:2104177-Pleurochrysis_carterae.AAC.2
MDVRRPSRPRWKPVRAHSTCAAQVLNKELIERIEVTKALVEKTCAQPNFAAALEAGVVSEVERQPTPRAPTHRAMPSTSYCFAHQLLFTEALGGDCSVCATLSLTAHTSSVPAHLYL